MVTLNAHLRNKPERPIVERYKGDTDIPWCFPPESSLMIDDKECVCPITGYVVYKSVPDAHTRSSYQRAVL